ncbi:DUF1572 family protein [Hymenobacter cavernae]|uniref:Uncharacterized protein n=1 Tax=Hymenobacter cavernae TaxID=2044852 RepID=A0ABQ1UQG4_9BACT|nr:DUF1572 family protein [Hymenobacter cavernae]GGF24067.1 hypothetical protein GCM10011383_39640 [Hymenobacter cavernae]
MTTPDLLAQAVLAFFRHSFVSYAYHTGQLDQLAKYLRGYAWQTLSITRGQSEQFTREVQRQPNH